MTQANWLSIQQPQLQSILSSKGYEWIEQIQNSQIFSTHIITNKGMLTPCLLSIYLLSDASGSMEEETHSYSNILKILIENPQPRLLQIQEYWISQHILFLVGEYFRGVQIDEFLLDNPISTLKGIKLLIQIAEGIDNLHRLGIVHGAIEPKNILIDSEENIKIVNAGVFYTIRKNEKPDAVSSAYQSPEKKAGETPTTLSDIYSLGILAYQMLSFASPEEGVFIPLLPKNLQKIVLSALQNIPKDRISSVKDFIQGIKQYSSKTTEIQIGKQQNEIIKAILTYQNRFYASKNLPSWPKMQLFLESYQGADISGVLYDFFEIERAQKKIYSIVFGEPSKIGIDGLLNMGTLRGALRSIICEKPTLEDCMVDLNRVLVADPLDESYTLIALELDPQTNTLSFLPCGSGVLWICRSKDKKIEMLTGKNLALGVTEETSFTSQTTSWNLGDILLLTTFSVANQISKEEIIQSLSQQEVSPKQILQDIVEKFHNLQHNQSLERTALFFIITRG